MENKVEKDSTKTNVIEKSFENITGNIDEIETLINMLLIALDNDFDTPKIPDVIDYILIIKNYLIEHKKLFKKLMQQLGTPNGKAKLLLLKTINSEKND